MSAAELTLVYDMLAGLGSSLRRVSSFALQKREGKEVISSERHGKTEAHKARIQLLDDIPVSQYGISFVMFGCLVLQIDCKNCHSIGSLETHLAVRLSFALCNKGVLA